MLLPGIFGEPLHFPSPVAVATPSSPCRCVTASTHPCGPLPASSPPCSVEDTDTARSTRASEEAMIRDLKWLGLDWDEGGWRQRNEAWGKRRDRGMVHARCSW